MHTATARVLKGPQGSGTSLDPARVRELTSLGDAVQRLFGAPQDVEWVIDAGGKAWLTQSRPITTLYPLPEDASPGPGGADRAAGGDTRVYLCGTLLQGLTRPLTPMGLSVLGLMRNSKGLWNYVNPGLRMYVDLTPIVRSKSGRKALLRLLPLADGRSAAVFPALLEDPRFSIVRPARGSRAGNARSAAPGQKRRALREPRAWF